MCEESIHHMETNKENSVSLPEWHSCFPATGPVVASWPVSVQPAVNSSHMPSPPLPTHSAPPQVCPHPRLTLHPENEAWKPGPGAAFCESKTARLRVSLIDMCQIIQAKKGKDAPPPPSRSLKKALPTPFPLSKALPSCCHLNIRAPPKEKGIWHAPFK